MQETVVITERENEYINITQGPLEIYQYLDPTLDLLNQNLQKVFKTNKQKMAKKKSSAFFSGE